jgi:hypothetical protein
MKSLHRVVLLLIGVAWVAGVAAQEPEPATVARIGNYVERYYARAQSIVAEESVVVQPLTRGLDFDGFARHLLYEVRLEWNPDADREEDAVTVVRRLLSAKGRRLGPPEQPDCLDPRAITPEPLAFLLPAQRHRYRFTMAGTGRVDGTPAVRVDYRPRVPEPPRVDWDGECGKIDLPGRIRGRVWADPVTSEILRFDESLVGQVELPPSPKRRPGAPLSFTLERADTTTIYKRVVFADPDETLLLPARVDSVTVIRNSGVPQLRVTQRFANYRRFVTGSRIVQ